MYKMHAAFKNIYRIRRSLSLISRETVDLPRGGINIKKRVVHMHVTHVFNLFSYNCCLQNMYVLMVDYCVKRVCFCLV